MDCSFRLEKAGKKLAAWKGNASLEEFLLRVDSAIVGKE